MVTCKLDAANARVHEARKKFNVYIWQIAKKYGKSESTMYRILRDELPEAEQDRIIGIIKEIAGERAS